MAASFPLADLPLEVIVTDILPKMTPQALREYLTRDPDVLRLVKKELQCKYLTEQGRACPRKTKFNLPKIGLIDCDNYCEFRRIPCQDLTNLFIVGVTGQPSVELIQDKVYHHFRFEVIDWSLVSHVDEALIRGGPGQPLEYVAKDGRKRTIPPKEIVPSLCHDFLGPYGFRIKLYETPRKILKGKPDTSLPIKIIMGSYAQPLNIILAKGWSLETPKPDVYILEGLVEKVDNKL